ncbi:MAG: Uma2 family endonuclease [Chloroflexales bacterium]|nr:Uma2 family endonuclease [Chloroflexales bacterium]
MSAQPKPHVTEDEYLAFERASMTKHEYYHGQIYAMTGASEPHNLIATNTIASLHSQLRHTSCRVYPSDMRVKIQQTGLYTYPDIMIICGQPQFTDDALDTIVNPTVIIEILSPSTERYDRGMKFHHYRTIETLRDYLLIAQDCRSIEHYTRQNSEQWLFQAVAGRENHIVFESIQCTLALEDVYEKVELEQEDAGIPREIPPE